jgi:hypothetical protein
MEYGKPPTTDMEVYETFRENFGDDARRLINEYDRLRKRGMSVLSAGVKVMTDELDMSRRKLTGLLRLN